MSTARSGIEKDRFLGTISPSTTCRNDTMSRAMMNAMVPIISSGNPVSANGSSSR